MFLKNKNNIRLDQLSQREKIKYLQKVTKVSLTNLKTNIIQSDLEEDDIQYPMSMNYSLQALANNRQINQIQSKNLSQKVRFVSQQEKLNKTIKNMTKQLYCQKQGLFRSQFMGLRSHSQNEGNIKLNINKASFIQDQGDHLYINIENQQTLKIDRFGQVIVRQPLTHLNSRRNNKKELLDIKFIPTNKIITARGSQPLLQATTRSNIFIKTIDFNQKSSNLNLQQNICQQHSFINTQNKGQKKQKFNRSNRKSINQSNKQNLIDRKEYSIKKQSNNLSGWVTKRQTKQPNPIISQKKQFSQYVYASERKVMNQIRIDLQQNKQNQINKEMALNYFQKQIPQNQQLDNIKQNIRKHKFFNHLEGCQDIQEMKQFCKLLLKGYKLFEIKDKIMKQL